MSNEMTKPNPKQFETVFRPELFVDLSAMQAIQRQGNRQILDARSEDSFNGQRLVHEPDLKPGHIPGSINIPYRHLYIEEGPCDLSISSSMSWHLQTLISTSRLSPLAAPVSLPPYCFWRFMS